ncbi:MAG TPA: hypothetical protein VFL86_23625, partial [Burkholderiaceae bacterium]|nr:hypothetical protein [Burkholderiaceae bacterium]
MWESGRHGKTCALQDPRPTPGTPIAGHRRLQPKENRMKKLIVVSMIAVGALMGSGCAVSGGQS